MGGPGQVQRLIGIPGSSLSYSLGQVTRSSLRYIVERNVEHALGGDESARLSGDDAYHHGFAPPLWLSLVNESSDAV